MKGRVLNQKQHQNIPVDAGQGTRELSGPGRELLTQAIAEQDAEEDADRAERTGAAVLGGNLADYCEFHGGEGSSGPDCPCCEEDDDARQRRAFEAARFKQGDEAIWRGARGTLSRRVTVVQVRYSYLATGSPKGGLVCDLMDPLVPGWARMDVPESQLELPTRESCWADPLTRAERQLLAVKLSRAAQAAWRATNAPWTRLFAELGDLHLDVTERAAAPLLRCAATSAPLADTETPATAKRHPLADAKFRAGDKAIWKGLHGNLHREVTIEDARSAYLVIFGHGPEDGQLVYDINDPVIGGTVFSIPADQIGPVPAETGAAR